MCGGAGGGDSISQDILSQSFDLFNWTSSYISVCIEYVMDITKSKLASSFFQSQITKTEQTIENT